VTQPELPRPDEYNAAIQNPPIAFEDPDLRVCRVLTNAFGLPIVYSGGFAITYRLEGPGISWAVRCFKKPVPDRQERYAAISRFLNHHQNGYLTRVEYQPSGIRVRGRSYPITKMEWIAGHPLNLYVERNLRQPGKINALANKLKEMVQHLESLGMAHGDLQHGNILVSASGQLTLVDYDGMFVPGLAGRRSSELGHPNYQHPRRSEKDFDASIDRFSAIVIYMALQAIALRPSLWNQYAAGGENMLFQSRDFVDPYGSSLLRELEQLPELSRLVADFRQVCTYADLTWVPRLSDFLEHKLRETAPSLRPQGPVTVKRPYEVISADTVEALAQKVGQRVEVVGQITDIHFGFTRYDSPYMFLNFGNWREGCFYLVLWEEALATFNAAGVQPDSYKSSWVSVTGVISTYRGRPQIMVSSPLEIERLQGEHEAQARLRPQPIVPSPGPRTAKTLPGIHSPRPTSPLEGEAILNEIYRNYPTISQRSKPESASSGKSGKSLVDKLSKSGKSLVDKLNELFGG